MDSDVGMVQDETYPTASSIWLQVKKQGNTLYDTY
jgi:hypothetical protein